MRALTEMKIVAPPENSPASGIIAAARRCYFSPSMNPLVSQRKSRESERARRLAGGAQIGFRWTTYIIVSIPRICAGPLDGGPCYVPWKGTGRRRP